MPDTLRCPNCGTEVQIASALAAQVRAEVLAQQQADTERLVREAAAKAAAEARSALSLEHDDMARRLEDVQAENSTLKQAELLLRRDREALEQERRDQELVVQRRMDEERRRVQDETRKTADEAHALEREQGRQKEAGLMRQVEDLQRKLAQGSQQSQGEAMEVSLEDLLRREFPADIIEPVAKGVKGADLVQRVRGAGGLEAGVILWESKRTKNWIDGWLPKLRDDQRDLKADVAALVSQVLPADAKPVSLIDAVWVSTFGCAPGLAHALRKGLLDVAEQRRAQEGRSDKEALLYAYLTGREFKSRIEGLLEPFLALKDDLDAEKRAVQSLWSKREQQIQRAIRSLAGLQGDVEGIAGNVLPTVRGLALPEAGPGAASATGAAR